MSKSYAKFKKEGHVPEQDGHFTVTFLPLIEGFECHDVKKRPALADDQWVEVIHRNGDRSRGPVETYAWGLYRCHPNDREDYHQFSHSKRGARKAAFDFLDLEITHYRATQTPPESWLQGEVWPFEELAAAA